MEKLFVAQERSNYSILIGLAIFESATGNTKNVIGTNFSPVYLAFKNGFCQVVGEETQFRKLESTGIARIKKNPQFVKDLIQRFKEKAKVLNDFTQTIHDADLTKKSNRELGELFDRFFQLTLETFPYGEPISWCLRFSFVQELEQELARFVPDKKKLGEYLTVLLSPDEPSFVNKEDKALLELALKLQKDPKIVGLFKQQVKEILRELPNHHEADELVKKHAKEWCWIPVDYESEPWTKEHFVETIKQYLEQHNIEKKRERLKTFTETMRTKKQAIIAELGIPKKLADLFQAVADAGYLQDMKKERHSFSHYHMKSWFAETHQRLGITLDQLRFMIPEEVKQGLFEGKISTSELDERYKLCVLELREHLLRFHYKEDAKKLFKQFETNIEDGKTELQGVCAMPGTVRGTARVLLDNRQLNTLQKGDILITTMTTPDFVPVMKKAKGIVTDEGGLTCHAAVVSREWGIPCVVGAKAATKLFKTGDVVELHGANGVVRKLG